MAAQKPLVAFFDQIDRSDIALVGGKGANLGEMVKAGFPVPGGFAVTTHAFDIFFEENSLPQKVLAIIKACNVENPVELQSASKEISKLILASRVPHELVVEIEKAYAKLSGRFRNALVAVRSSATAEDLPSASFAGQQETYLNVKGLTSVVEHVRRCYASLFTARAIYYRGHNSIDTAKTKLSAIIQKMVQSEVSGVAFTVDPVTNEKDRIIIEAVYGLGELIVQGGVVPDRYVVQKETFAILSKQVSEQKIQLQRKGAENKELKVATKLIGTQKLDDVNIVALAKLADKLQKHYYFPQDIEWASEKDKLFITQTRPITTLGEAAHAPSRADKEVEVASTPVLVGLGASPGMATGTVVIVTNPKDVSKVKEGDVLVSIMTSPDFVPAMKVANAIVTDQGGQTSHAAIVSREMGVPCVVGTKDATKKLKEGMLVSVDGTKGLVFLGSKIVKDKIDPVKVYKGKLKTATKLYVNLAEPDKAKQTAKENVDGVGLLRAEFMIADIGIHPREAIKLKKQEVFVDKLVSGLTKFCQAFDGKPVVYRATDFKTNEYRSLKGGKLWEPEEPNPMLGFRGAFRYIANPEVFTLELNAIKKVRERYKNLYLMIPYVRSPNELSRVRRMVSIHGLLGDPTFKLWMMVELPVNVINLEDFIKVGIDGVSIGSNDLTMLLLGTDRDNAEVATAFDEVSPALIWSLKRIIKICKKHKVTVSICGQAPSSHDELVSKMVKMGITSISVNPDAIARVRNIIYEEEKLK